MDNFDKIPYQNLGAVKLFIKRKTAKPKILRLYECDSDILDMLKKDASTLEEL
jgi:hypothetical protein